MLGVFKYLGLFVDSAQTLISELGYQADPFMLSIVLLVGISLLTFQTLSHTIDIYRKGLEPTRDFLDFALFVAFFPQLVAGPIERGKNLLPNIAAATVRNAALSNRSCELAASSCFSRWFVMAGFYFGRHRFRRSLVSPPAFLDRRLRPRLIRCQHHP